MPKFHENPPVAFCSYKTAVKTVMPPFVEKEIIQPQIYNTA